MGVSVRVIGSTQIGHNLSKEEVLNMGGHLAGYCSSENTIDEILDEDPKITAIKRKITLENGHHSVYGHAHYLLDIQGPKFLMMLLNARRVMNTSEKSARYTKMVLSEDEQPLYDKWLGIFEGKILKEYPDIDGAEVVHGSRKSIKLAQENARYLTSVFTPTQMGHTLSFRELNSAIYEFKQFIDNAEATPFNTQVKDTMQEFIDDPTVQELYVPKLNPSVKGGEGVEFIQEDEFPREQFGSVYSVNYDLSFAGVAQTHRHRSLDYRIKLPKYPKFFIPPIIREDSELVSEWLKDIQSVASHFPQGMLVEVNERGRIEAFRMKAYERLCGCAQLEIMQNTADLAEKLLRNIEPLDPKISDKLKPLLNGPRCTFSDDGCPGDNCYFGPKNGVDRKI
jgi:hypothetical protein